MKPYFIQIIYFENMLKEINKSYQYFARSVMPTKKINLENILRFKFWNTSHAAIFTTKFWKFYLTFIYKTLNFIFENFLVNIL